MSTEFKLPDLGENISEAQVVSVLVSPGDRVEPEQAVIEVETDKAVMEVPCSTAGTIEKVNVSEGDTLKVGDILVTLSEDGQAKGGDEDKKEKDEEKPKPDEQAQEETGSKAERADASDRRDEEPAKEQAPEKEPQPAASSGRTPVAAAPSVRQFAREIGVDIAQVAGAGPGGRIGIDDVKKHARENKPGDQPLRGKGEASGIPPLPDFTQWGRVEREAISNVRKKTAEHMAVGWSAPHVTLHDHADTTNLENLRRQYAKLAEKAGGKLTPTAIILKIVALGLKKHPPINCSFDVERREIIRKDYIHIGVAADTARGLVVPVLRDVDTKSIVDIAVELGEMADKAREGKLSLGDMAGGTFTVTNLGGIGIGHFTPIINHPEVAILGVGRANRQPVWSDESGDFEPRLMMPLSLSFDHRVVDGADGARFLRWIVEACANPLFMQM